MVKMVAKICKTSMETRTNMVMLQLQAQEEKDKEMSTSSKFHLILSGDTCLKPTTSPIACLMKRETQNNSWGNSWDRSTALFTEVTQLRPLKRSSRDGDKEMVRTNLTTMDRTTTDIRKTTATDRTTMAPTLATEDTSSRLDSPLLVTAPCTPRECQKTSR